MAKEGREKGSFHRDFTLRLPKSSDIPDIHTPAMIVNSLMLGFTVQSLISQNPVVLAEGDFFYVKSCVTRSTCLIPSLGFFQAGNFTVLLTIVTLLVSIFAMLMRYMQVVLAVRSKYSSYSTIYVAVDICAAVAVTILTMVNLGYFLIVIAKAAASVFPLYQATAAGLNNPNNYMIDLIDQVSTFNPEDPYLLTVSNATDTSPIMNSLSGAWLLYNSLVYIVLGIALAVVAFTPLAFKLLQCLCGFENAAVDAQKNKHQVDHIDEEE